MTKMIKMSLVAAVVVAGFTTSAAAAVKTSGFVSYTSEYKGIKNAEAEHDIDVRVNFKAAVTDSITANVRVDESNDQDSGVNSSSLNMDVDRAYFSIKSNGLTTNFGLQGAPLTDGAQADGLTIAKNLGGASVAAGYLYTTAAGPESVIFVAVNGKAGAVSYNVAFANAQEDKRVGSANNKATFLHAGVKGKFDAINVALNYASKTGMATGNKDQSQVKLSVGANVDKLALSLAYAKNGSEGGKTMIDGSDAAGSNISMGATNLEGATDGSSAIHFSVSAAIDAATSAKLQYAAIMGDTSATTEEKTTRLTITNKMAKNFKVWVEYENYAESANKSELTLGAKYSF